MRHMTQLTGERLRELRKQSNISQARLAEVSSIPQYLLSSFELGKCHLASSQLAALTEILVDTAQHAAVLRRRKRYREQTYQGRKIDPERSRLCVATAGNAAFLKDLNSLERESRSIGAGLSLFSGVGGFSLGFKRAGFRIKGFVEISDELSEIYKANFPGVPRLGYDITKLDSRIVSDFVKINGPIDVVIGGPPCQGFSLSGKRDIEDPRNYLFEEYMRVIDVVRPKIAVVENVRLLTSMKAKNGNLVKDRILRAFTQHGYQSRMFEINAANYGVPQHRERVLFVAVRDDLRIIPSCPPMTRSTSRDDLFSRCLPLRTFGDACSDLPYLESGETSNDPHHCAVDHPDHVIEWLWNVPQGASAHDNEDPTLRPPSGYNTTYKRQVWNEPASTVQTTFGMISGCRNVHPIATRSLTIREAARIQTFPDSYRWVGTQGTIRTGIGNAVPPLLALRIGQHIRALLANLVEVPGLKVEL